MPARKMRQTIQDLLDLGVLISYELHHRWGQSVTVWGEDGRPVRMCLSAARVYADRLADMDWGLLG